MSENSSKIESGHFEETAEFKAKKRQFFLRLGLQDREVLKMHKDFGLWEQDEKGEKSWQNVSEHCLVESARAEVFAEKLQLSEKTKRDLKLAAALHDFYKKEDIEATKKTLKEGGLMWPMLKKQAEKELQVMHSRGIDQSVIRIKESVGGEPWTIEAITQILEKQEPLSDEDVACLVLHYIDDYTQGTHWALPMEINSDGKKINELDRRYDKNEANPNYKKLDLEGINERGETIHQAGRRIGHEVEAKIAQMLQEKSGVRVDPLDLPEFIDNELRSEIEAL